MDYTAVRKEEGAGDTAGGAVGTVGCFSYARWRRLSKAPTVQSVGLKAKGQTGETTQKNNIPQQDTVMTEDDTDCRIRFLSYLPWHSVECLHRAGTQPSSYPQDLQWSRTQLLE